MTAWGTPQEFAVFYSLENQGEWEETGIVGLVRMVNFPVCTCSSEFKYVE